LGFDVPAALQPFYMRGTFTPNPRGTARTVVGGIGILSFIFLESNHSPLAAPLKDRWAATPRLLALTMTHIIRHQLDDDDGDVTHTIDECIWSQPSNAVRSVPAVLDSCLLLASYAEGALLHQPLAVLDSCLLLHRILVFYCIFYIIRTVESVLVGESLQE